MRTAYGVVIGISLALFFSYARAQYSSMLNLIHERFRQTGEELDSNLKRVTDHVDSVRIQAERFISERNQSRVADDLFQRIKQQNEAGIYTLDEMPETHRPETTGNVTGQGGLKRRKEEFYRDLRMALSLNPVFEGVFHNLPSVTWAYFTSVERFLLIYPWAPSKDYCFSDKDLTKEFYTLGSPERNSERKRFWTGAYMDDAGKGLLVSCGAPVYLKEEFRGTVAVDTTLEELNKILGRFPYPDVDLLLLNDNGQLLAHPRLVTPKDKEVKDGFEYLRAKFQISADKLRLLESGRLQHIEGYVVASHSLPSAPWRLIMLAPRNKLLLDVITESSLLVGFMILGLTAILAMANYFTKREFVTPAEQLVAHIAQSAKRPDVTVPEVPAAWRPWFEIITGIFRENARLLNELREQNAHLDNLVAQRTQELSVRNEELEQAMNQLKEMQKQIVMQEKLAALGGLTAGIAHEIKNPLNFVNNFSQLSGELFSELEEIIEKQKDRFAPETLDDIESLVADLKTNVQKINEHGKRADSIVKGMLLHSRGKSGERQETNINALVQEYVNLAYHGMRAQDASFNVKLETFFDPAVGMLQVVPQDLSRAVLNLVNNACYAAYDAAQTKGPGFMPTVIISTKAGDSNIDIRIKDNGNGIPAEIREKVFAPFFTTKPPGKGTGLGLSISFQIVVEQHHGELLLETEAGGGTEFVIRLPKKRVAVSAPAPTLQASCPT